MNRNYLQYAALMLVFTFINPSFAMYGAIFKLARTVGVTTLPACGLYLFNEESKQHQKSYEFTRKLPLISERAITKWGKEKAEQLHVPNGEKISFMYGLDWATSAEQFVVVPRWKGYQLNYALQVKNSSCMELFYKIRYLVGDDPEKVIAQHSMCLKHEFGHIINKDNQNRVYYLATIPVAVEAMAFGATQALRKLCDVQQPKTFLKTMLRSCSAVGAIIPKAVVGSFTYISSKRYQEARADRFACENAESRLELEEYEKCFQQSTNNIKKPHIEDLMFIARWTGRFDSIPEDIRGEYVKYFEKGLQEVVRQLNDPNLSEQRKRTLNYIYQLINSPDHPSSESRAKNVRRYIDKWDKDHAHETGE